MGVPRDDRPQIDVAEAINRAWERLQHGHMPEDGWQLFLADEVVTAVVEWMEMRPSLGSVDNAALMAAARIVRRLAGLPEGGGNQ